MNIAHLVVIIAFTMATGFTAGGVWVLAGAGWAMVALGVACFIVCGVLLRGVRVLNGG